MILFLTCSGLSKDTEMYIPLPNRPQCGSVVPFWCEAVPGFQWKRKTKCLFLECSKRENMFVPWAWYFCWTRQRVLTTGSNPIKGTMTIWVNYNDLTRPHPKWWFMWGIAPQPLIFAKAVYSTAASAALFFATSIWLWVKTVLLPFWG